MIYNIEYIVSDGDLRYDAATKYNRDGAAEDAISFRSTDKSKPRAAIILPCINAEATAAVRASLKWSLTDSECSVSITLPDGKPAEVRKATGESQSE